MDFSLRVRDDLLRLFKASVKTNDAPETNRRAMAKLLKEAERVKQVLSANTETIAQVPIMCITRGNCNSYRSKT